MSLDSVIIESQQVRQGSLIEQVLQPELQNIQLFVLVSKKPFGHVQTFIDSTISESQHVMHGSTEEQVLHPDPQLVQVVTELK
jgi:hypothetical protein